MDIVRFPNYLEVDTLDDVETDVEDLILDEDMVNSKAKKGIIMTMQESIILTFIRFV